MQVRLVLTGERGAVVLTFPGAKEAAKGERTAFLAAVKAAVAAPPPAADGGLQLPGAWTPDLLKSLQQTVLENNPHLANEYMVLVRGGIVSAQDWWVSHRQELVDAKLAKAAAAAAAAAARSDLASGIGGVAASSRQGEVTLSERDTLEIREREPAVGEAYAAFVERGGMKRSEFWLAYLVARRDREGLAERGALRPPRPLRVAGMDAASFFEAYKRGDLDPFTATAGEGDAAAAGAASAAAALRKARLDAAGIDPLFDLTSTLGEVMRQRAPVGGSAVASAGSGAASGGAGAGAGAASSSGRRAGYGLTESLLAYEEPLPLTGAEADASRRAGLDGRAAATARDRLLMDLNRRGDVMLRGSAPGSNGAAAGASSGAGSNSKARSAGASSSALPPGVSSVGASALNDLVDLYEGIEEAKLCQPLHLKSPPVAGAASSGFFAAEAMQDDGEEVAPVTLATAAAAPSLSEPPPLASIFTDVARKRAATVAAQEMARSAQDITSAQARTKVGFSTAIPGGWQTFILLKFAHCRQLLRHFWTVQAPPPGSLHKPLSGPALAAKQAKIVAHIAAEARGLQLLRQQLQTRSVLDYEAPSAAVGRGESAGVTLQPSARARAHGATTTPDSDTQVTTQVAALLAQIAMPLDTALEAAMAAGVPLP